MCNITGNEASKSITVNAYICCVYSSARFKVGYLHFHTSAKQTKKLFDLSNTIQRERRQQRPKHSATAESPFRRWLTHLSVVSVDLPCCQIIINSSQPSNEDALRLRSLGKARRDRQAQTEKINTSCVISHAWLTSLTTCRVSHNRQMLASLSRCGNRRSVRRRLFEDAPLSRSVTGLGEVPWRGG